MSDVVRVLKGDRFVGLLTADERGQVAFAYDRAVLDAPEAAVSVRLPVRAAPYPDHQARPCFENLLPEGDLRRLLAVATKRSPGDVVGMLGVFGGECAGALTLWPEGTAPDDPPRYEPCDAARLATAFGSAAEVSGLAATMRRGRLSMSGAQEKLVLHRTPVRPDAAANGAAGAPAYFLPLGGAPGTVLVKRDRGGFPGLVQAELATMHLMASAGVPTAEHRGCALDRGSYETVRFDRVPRDGAPPLRLHAEDGCQLTGRLSHAKYASSGGPSLQELTAVVRRYGSAPGTDVELLCRWALANLAVGNRDGHAKNVSMLHHADGAFRLAPAYDVVCTLAYPALDTDFALRFGGAARLAELSPHALRIAARGFGLVERRVRELADEVTTRVLEGLPDALAFAAREAGEDPVLGRVETTVRGTAAECRRRLLGA